MEKPLEYHPKYKRFVMDTKPDSLALFKTLGFFGIGYYLAHTKMFSKFGTPMNIRLVYAGLIALSATGWKMALKDPMQGAIQRNNITEMAHQRVFDR